MQKKTKKEIFGFDEEVNIELSFNNINNSDTAEQILVLKLTVI